jgi:hypothetical protein
MDNLESNNNFQQNKNGLFDIFIKIVKYRKLFLFSCFMVSLSGVMVAIMLPAKYSYTSLIGLGTNYEGQPLESVAITRAKLNAVIIPIAEKNYRDEGGVHDVSVEVLVKSPHMILLESRGSIESAKDNLNIHKTIFESLLKDHQIILKKEYERVILPRKKIMNKLSELDEERALMNKNLKRLDEIDIVLKKQAIKTDANLALLQIILNNQIELNRTIMRKSLFDNKLDRDEARTQLSSVDKSIDEQHKTFFAVSPTQSKNSVGPNRILIAIVGILSGLFTGILSVLTADFLSKQNRKEK